MAIDPQSGLMEAFSSTAPAQRAMPAYLGRGRLLTALSGGQPIIVDTENLDIGASIIQAGCWEPWVARYLAQFVLQHGDPVIADVGANIGYYSVALGALTRSRRVWAFEPNSRAFAILCENLMVNGISREGAHRIALGTGESNQSLRYMPGESGGATVGTGDARPGAISEKVTVKPLDSVLPRHVLVDLLKVDVQGAEPQVLKGAWSAITRSRNIMLCVAHSPAAWKGQGYDPIQVLQELASEGFKLRLALHDGLVEDTASGIVRRAAGLNYVTSVLACRDWSKMDGDGARERTTPSGARPSGPQAFDLAPVR